MHSTKPPASLFLRTATTLGAQPRRSSHSRHCRSISSKRSSGGLRPNNPFPFFDLGSLLVLVAAEEAKAAARASSTSRSWGCVAAALANSTNEMTPSPFSSASAMKRSTTALLLSLSLSCSVIPDRMSSRSAGEASNSSRSSPPELSPSSRSNRRRDVASVAATATALASSDDSSSDVSAMASPRSTAWSATATSCPKMRSPAIRMGARSRYTMRKAVRISAFWQPASTPRNRTRLRGLSMHSIAVGDSDSAPSI
mmetsp:Transcript_29520/g.28390  ORF Transcript_29520/g.28390 Transcript_29520/m.28390 type:complete len:255 (+) Transcript_29520:284-1048(+)